MALNGPIAKQPKSLDFISSLLLYTHRRDTALGIEWHSQRTLGLCWYYNYLLKERVQLQIGIEVFKRRMDHYFTRRHDLVKKAERYKSPKKRKEALEKLQEINLILKRMEEKLG